MPVGASQNPEGVRIPAAAGPEPGDTRRPLHHERGARPEADAGSQPDDSQVASLLPLRDTRPQRSSQRIGAEAHHWNYKHLCHIRDGAGNWKRQVGRLKALGIALFRHKQQPALDSDLHRGGERLPALLPEKLHGPAEFIIPFERTAIHGGGEPVRDAVRSAERRVRKAVKAVEVADAGAAVAVLADPDHRLREPVREAHAEAAALVGKRGGQVDQGVIKGRLIPQRQLRLPRGGGRRGRRGNQPGSFFRRDLLEPRLFQMQAIPLPANFENRIPLVGEKGDFDLPLGRSHRRGCDARKEMVGPGLPEFGRHEMLVLLKRAPEGVPRAASLGINVAGGTLGTELRAGVRVLGKSQHKFRQSPGRTHAHDPTDQHE